MFRSFGILSLVLALSTPHAGATGGESGSSSEGRKPNVIWICLDALRAKNLSCYGYDRPTSPHIDRLAARGVLLEQNYSQGAWTSVSVPSYMTGRYFPAQCVYMRNAPDLYLRPPEQEVLFPAIMAANGYRTVLFAVSPYFGPKSRLHESFQEATVLPAPEGRAYASFETLNQHVLPWIESCGETPFFLYMHLLDTHFPHYIEPPFDRWLDLSYESPVIKGGVPVSYDATFSAMDQEYLRGLYDGSIRYADEQVGALIARLDALGLTERTIVIISSDHGEALGEDGRSWGHRGLFNDENIHVPLIVSGPGLPRGRRVPSLTENADIVPTLIELLSLDNPAEPDGKSLLSVIAGPGAEAVHEYTVTFLVGQIMIRDAAYKYVRCLDSNRELLLRVPDLLGKREEVGAQNHGEAAKRRQFVEERLMPRYNSYRALPFGPPSGTFEMKAYAMDAEPKDAFVGAAASKGSLHSDNRWTYKHQDCSYWSNAQQEDAPPITLHFRVPNGHYQARIEMYCRSDYNGRPASALRVKAEHSPQFTKIVSEEGQSGYCYIDIGRYHVRDESFDLTIDEGDPAYWAYFRQVSLTVIPAGDNVTTTAPTAEDAESLEQFRALGYLD